MSVVKGRAHEAMNPQTWNKNYSGQKAMLVKSRCGGGSETKPKNINVKMVFYVS